MRVLILGGTAEANALARGVWKNTSIQATLSLAGRTQQPVLPPISCRVGGFGGAAGLARYLTENAIDRLIDATHPFAAQISYNAVAAAAATGTPLLAIRRPPWQRSPGDQWIDVATMADAASALGPGPQHVFLAVGRQELAPFRDLAHHFIIRSVEAPDEPPAGAIIITARGPFDIESETALLRDHRIDWLVTKNSGGVTGEKLIAARTLGLKVIMVARPEKPAVANVPDHVGALAWLHGTERGV